MQVQPHNIIIITYPIQELDELEGVITAYRRMLQTLEERRDRMLLELDQITQPSSPKPAPTTKWLSPRVEFKGEIRFKWSFIDLYACALERLWLECPHLRHEMAAAIAACGNKRQYVATSREELFPGKSLGWAMKHSRELTEGWYFDTNMNLERMRRVLVAAVRASGLRWGRDVKVHWKGTKGSIAGTTESHTR